MANAIEAGNTNQLQQALQWAGYKGAMPTDVDGLNSVLSSLGYAPDAYMRGQTKGSGGLNLGLSATALSNDYLKTFQNDGDGVMNPGFLAALALVTGGTSLAAGGASGAAAAGEGLSSSAVPTGVVNVAGDSAATAGMSFQTIADAGAGAAAGGAGFAGTTLPEVVISGASGGGGMSLLGNLASGVAGAAGLGEFVDGLNTAFGDSAGSAISGSTDISGDLFTTNPLNSWSASSLNPDWLNSISDYFTNGNGISSVSSLVKALLGENGTSGTGSGSNNLSSLLRLLGGAYGLSQSGNAVDAADKIAEAQNPFGPQRAQYATQLSNLMANPSSITSDTGYQFGMDQGTQAIARRMAGSGYTGSGNEAIALQNYGQGYASNYLNNRITQLSQLAGAQFNGGSAAPLTAVEVQNNAVNSSLNGINYALKGLLNG